jgi:hypothetical protein
MWINLDDQQLEYVKAAMIAFAEGNERDAKLFWTEELRETRERLEQEAKDYRVIAAKIDEAKADFDEDDPYRAAAKEDADDELEIDDDAVVSPGSDPGAWVHAWVWIPERKAGLFTCEECSGLFTVDRCADGDTCDECARDDDDDNTCRTCGEPYEEGGDGYDGECPSCADKTDQKLHPENYED